MCLATGLLIGGIAISAMGAISNAQSQKNVANYNSEVAQRDASISLDQGNAQAAIQARQARGTIGAGVAQYGASGVDVNSGSPLDVLRDSAEKAELDRQTILYNAKTRAAGFQGEALGYDYQGGAASQRGYWQAGSTTLQGLAAVYANRRYNGPGMAIPVSNTSDGNYSNQG
jgi:hypothetical protein